MARLAYLIFLSTVIASSGARVDAGNAEGVTISGMVVTQADALQLAEGHCSKYGKAARIQQIAEPRSGRRVWNFIFVRPGTTGHLDDVVRRRLLMCGVVQLHNGITSALRLVHPSRASFSLASGPWTDSPAAKVVAKPHETAPMTHRRSA
jgi:hypothetical protein